MSRSSPSPSLWLNRWAFPWENGGPKFPVPIGSLDLGVSNVSVQHTSHYNLEQPLPRLLQALLLMLSH